MRARLGSASRWRCSCITRAISRQPSSGSWSGSGITLGLGEGEGRPSATSRADGPIHLPSSRNAIPTRGTCSRRYDLGEAHAAGAEARAIGCGTDERCAGAGTSDDTDEPVDFRTRELAPPNLPRGVVPEIVERFAEDQELGLGVERGAPAAALLTALGSLMTSPHRLADAASED